ncbi:hypothetical protein [Nostoc sp.]
MENSISIAISTACRSGFLAGEYLTQQTRPSLDAAAPHILLPHL